MAFNDQAELILNLSKKGRITIGHFSIFNLYLDEIIKNANAFIIRLVVLNTQLLYRAYEKLPKYDIEKLYEVEVTDNLIRFIGAKLDHEEIEQKYDLIRDLKSKNKIEKTYKGMEKKDTLIKIFLKILDGKYKP